MNNPHPRHTLFHFGIEFRCFSPYFPVGDTEFLAEEPKDGQDEGGGDKGDQRQFEVETGHDEKNPGEGEKIIAEIKYSTGKKLGYGINVMGHPGSDNTGLLPVIEGHVKPQQFTEEIPAQRINDLLAYPFGEESLPVGGQPKKDLGRQEGQEDQVQTVKV